MNATSLNMWAMGALTVLLTMCLASTASAQRIPVNATEENPSEALLVQMHIANAVQIRMGAMAIEKGESEKVRRLGDRLMRDHALGDERVEELAERFGISLPTVDLREMEKMPKERLDRVQQRMMRLMRRLKASSGPSFDREFVRGIQKSHRTMIGILKQAARKVEEEPIREWVMDVLPILRQHGALASIVEDELSSGAS